MTTSQTPGRRAGFTLIEMLVVIGIIGALAALALGAYQRVRNSRNIANTTTALQKIGSALEMQFQAATGNAPRGEDLTKPTSRYYTFFTLGGNDAVRGRALALKYALRREFPVSQAEAGLTLRGYGAARAGFANVPNGLTPQEQSAVLLYRTLAQNRGGASSMADDAGPGATKLLGSTNERVFMDAWGNPIYMARWKGDGVFPTLAETELNSQINHTTKRDPADPEGSFQKSGWPVALRTQAAAELGGNALDDNYYIPFAVSNGPDEQPNTDDDIYSFRVRAIGKRGD